MKEMHWTYADYQATPPHVIDEVYVMMRTEQEKYEFDKARPKKHA